MPYVPNQLKDKKAQQVQAWFIGAGVVSGFVAFGAFSGGNGATGIWAVLVSAGLIWIGSKIKTSRSYNSSNYR